MSSTNQIETLAKSRIEIELNDIPNIETAFNSKDKFPSFDGNIYVYKQNKIPTTKKENILGMLPSQIKGRTHEKLPKQGKRSFSIDKDDMRIYYSANGIIYFIVIFLKNNNDNFRIYYNYLAPYQLKEKFKGDNKSAKFTFFEFTPKAKKEFYSYCKRSLELSKQQAPLAQKSIEDQTGSKEINKETYDTFCFSGSTDDAIFFNISFQKESERNGKMTITTTAGDWRLLSKVEDWIPSAKLKNGFTIPIEQSSIVKFSIHEIRNEPLKFSNVAGELFYDRQRIEEFDDYIKVTLSACVELLIYKRKVTANLNSSGTLADRITAISFLNSLVNNELLIDGKPLKLKDFPKEGLATDLPEMYASVKRIDRLLNDIPILSLLRHKKIPCDVINYLEHISSEYYSTQETTENVGYVFSQKEIDTISIVIIKHTFLMDGKKVQQFFDPFDGEVDDRIKLCLMNKKELTIVDKISFFCFPKVDFWELAMNLNADAVVDSVFSLDFENKTIREKVNLLVLNLLSAYDKVNRENLLSLAWDIIKKLDSHKDADEDYFHLNLLQTKKRLFGEFDTDDISWLMSHIEGQYKNTPIGCAALALMGHKQAANKRLDTLSKSDREQIINFPIAYFF